MTESQKTPSCGPTALHLTTKAGGAGSQIIQPAEKTVLKPISEQSANGMTLIATRQEAICAR